jgi:non-ribosomal peptide synthetase component E (peptide arylation enzyme)
MALHRDHDHLAHRWHRGSRGPVRPRYADKGVVSKWAVPSRVRTVAALDKTSVGKLEKKVMRQKYA